VDDVVRQPVVRVLLPQVNRAEFPGLANHLPNLTYSIKGRVVGVILGPIGKNEQLGVPG
jgi:hypothetical protein